MCVIISSPKGVKPTLDVLEKCHEANPDGAGVAWATGGGVQWEKGLTGKEVFKIIQGVDKHFAVHFRWATVGGVGSQLTHPFPVTADVSLKKRGTAPKLLMHNGHWHPWEKARDAVMWRHKAALPSGPWSDSPAIAWVTGFEG